MTQGLPYPSPTPMTGQVAPNPSPAGKPVYATVAVTADGQVYVTTASQQQVQFSDSMAAGMWGDQTASWPGKVDWL